MISRLASSLLGFPSHCAGFHPFDPPEMERQASAVWNGTLRDGNGTMTAPSGVLHNASYTFGTRFEATPGTNPEELIAAAHAGCFSMAFSGKLTAAGFPPERIATTATVTLEKTEAGFTITAVHLKTTARVPGASAEVFAAEAESARQTCPVSRVLNTRITLDATLE
ncbi:MAG TPA: OsmC family protein [Gemmatimonadaceae bacterium]